VSRDTIPTSLPVPLESLVNLAVEHWRLANWLSNGHTGTGAGAAPARHVVRKMEDFLKRCDLEVRSLDGMPFDPGLAARVVDTADAPELPEGATVICQTLSPMVLWRGRVVRGAEVATRRGIRKS
jgi:hypothetical protein